MTDEHGREPNRKGSQEMKCRPALSLEELWDATYRLEKPLCQFAEIRLEY